MEGISMGTESWKMIEFYLLGSCACLQPVFSAYDPFADNEQASQYSELLYILCED